MNKPILRLLSVVAGILWTISLQAAPAAPKVQSELIAEVTAVTPGEPFEVALVQDIDPGWHTYWRNPGDSGAPTEIIWDLPDGFSAGEIRWPYPERIPYGPLVNFGYHDRVVFPIEITPPESLEGDTVSLRARAEYLVCADICIPEDADVGLILPVSAAGSTRDPDNATLFSRARQKIPRDIGVEANYSVEGDTLAIHVKVGTLKRARLESATYFPYQEGVIENTREQDFRLTDAGFLLTTKTGYNYEAGQSSFDGIIVVSEDSGEALSSAFRIQPTAAAVREAHAQMDLLTAVLFGFLGGLILNLMPCVFPVLSIKVLSLLGHADSREVKFHGLFYLGGVVLSFLSVAAVLIALRAGGAEIGWGFQLQSPVVVGLLVYLFFLIGLMLSGYLQAGLSLMNVGQTLTAGQGYSASFFTGVLATVVAAPCTAPFMGAAIGFALTRGNVGALAIFGSLGFGMGVPYLVLCYSPPLLERLPRPGPWMESFKELLAFPMYASAVWLIWVLTQQSGPQGVLLVLSGIVLIAFGVWLLKRVPRTRGPRVVSRGFALLILIGALALPALTERPGAAENRSAAGPTVADDGLNWQEWSPEKVAAARESGPVFVNFTAAWCITCKVNESVALDSVAVVRAFEEAGVELFKGDWTNEDPRITAALAEYGRSGVPLYLLYPEGEDRALVLPQILTESIVIDAVQSL